MYVHEVTIRKSAITKIHLVAQALFYYYTHVVELLADLFLFCIKLLVSSRINLGNSNRLSCMFHSANMHRINYCEPHKISV